MSGGLDDLVTEAAAKLMAATAADHAAISEQVVADTVSQFGVDFGFLRHNDHTIHATVLVALWPIVVIMGVLGVLIVLAQGSAVAPFIYTLF